MNRPELLMPAGSPEVLRTVIRFGADAVYLGGDSLSLRAKARNFDEEQLTQALRYAHAHGVRVYMTVNIFAHNGDLAEGRRFFSAVHAREEKPDAFIMSDFGLIHLARTLCPEVPIHISTQTNSTNYETFNFWYGLGVRRVVCARELSLEEIREIRAHIPADMEIEAFVHGAMCMSYSGRCLISNFLTGRDANRGACTHPCRWRYYLTEETRPGEYMPIEEDDRGTYLYNSRDLCMIEHLPELLGAGVTSLKVEGRMKNALYAASVARAYRLAIDTLLRDPAAYEARRSWFLEETEKCTTRTYCTGFYFGRPGPEAQNYGSSTYVKDWSFLGEVETDAGGVFITQKNKFSVGDCFEAIRPDGTNLSVTVTGMQNGEGERVSSCPHPGEKIYLTTDKPLLAGDILRQENRT